MNILGVDDSNNTNIKSQSCDWYVWQEDVPMGVVHAFSKCQDRNEGDVVLELLVSIYDNIYVGDGFQGGCIPRYVYFA